MKGLIKTLTLADLENPIYKEGVLDLLDVSTIEEAKKKLKVKTDKKVNEKLIANWNMTAKLINQTNAKIQADKQKKKEARQAKKNSGETFLKSIKVVNPSSKKSQTERLKIRQTNSVAVTDLPFYVVNIPANKTECLEFLKENDRPYHATDRNGKILHQYYFNIQSFDDITKAVMSAYDKQTKAFKISVNFGYIFERFDEKDGRPIISYSYGKPYENSKYFIEAKLVQNKKQLKANVLSKLHPLGLREFLNKLAPDTKTKLIGIYSIYIKIFPTDYNIGSKIDLPEYITKNKNVCSMQDSINNMCFWNCYAFHLTKDKRSLKLAKEEFKNYYGIASSELYVGFDLNNEMSIFETSKNISINVYELNQKFEVTLFRESELDYENTMNLLLYKNHFCYISNLDALSHVYKCCKCGYAFDELKLLKRHTKFCQDNVKCDEFPSFPEVYEPKRNLIIELNEKYGTSCNFRSEYFIVYDFESLCLKENKERSEKLKIVNKQQAVSVSLYSNIPGYNEEIFIENQDVKELFRLMFIKIDEMCDVATYIMRQEYEPLLEILNKSENKGEMNQLLRYFYQIPIVGFNSGSYDINLNISEFMNELYQRFGKEIMAIKNGNKFKTISTATYLFLDICQYIPPNYNLDQYIKAFNKGGLKKSVFPYEFLDSYDKLEFDINLIERKHFYSSLKNSNISDEEWNEFLENKVKHEWKTVRDLLKFYNNLDVKPFLEAVINQRNFFYDLNIDMFKDGMSLPGLSEKILFSFAFKEFNEEFINELPPKPKNGMHIIDNIDSKLMGYKSQDKSKERYNNNNFIKKDEVKKIIAKQNTRCIYCWKNLQETDWSLDRIDNTIGHNSGNCLLSCIKCNVYRKNENYKTFYRKKALYRYSKYHPMIHLIDEKNKIVFEKLKSNICGGPSIVFHRYHEADKTKIRRPYYENNKWHIGKEEKTVKNITGFDANALYLWCIGNTMACGVLEYIVYDETNNGYEQEFIKYNSNAFFEVDITTPEELFNKFSEFPIVFKNAEFDVNEEAGDYMKEIFDENDTKEVRKTRKLISSFKGDKILIKGDRLNWMMKHGLVVTKIHGYIPFTEGKPFENFMLKVSEERRKGDVDEDYAIIAEMWKLVGNSAFGRTGMDKSVFQKTKYGDINTYFKSVGKETFKNANQYDDIFEISMSKMKTLQNIPIQVACCIYDDAKFKMSSFYYDCVDKYISREDYQYIEMDTDSAYMALTGDFFSLIKPEMKEEFEKDKHNWFLRDDTPENKAFDKRKPGLFKPEWIGSGMVALTCKMYYGKKFKTDLEEEEKRQQTNEFMKCNEKLKKKGESLMTFCQWVRSEEKCSSKGIQERHNLDKINFEVYKDVLLGKNHSVEVTNKGLRIFSENGKQSIYNYECRKTGLTQKYDKRIILSDKISSIPLSI